MKRVVNPELLDSDQGSRAEVEASLGDLRRVNRWFGGTRVMRQLVQEVAERSGLRRLEMLDVGAASGDVPLAVRRELASRGLEVEVTLLDRVEEHMRSAPNRGAASGRPGEGGGARTIVGDALALPFRDKAFDVVGCSLLAHHLEPQELARFVNEGARVARVAVLINDLVRSRLHLALAYAGMPLYRSRLTRHDAPASVRRAYTPAEMRSIVSQTAARRVEISRHYLCRMGVVAWV